MAAFTLSATIEAPVETVFEVLTDHRGYSRITSLRSSTLEREGSPDPNGVGAIRVLALAGPPIREEVTVFERPQRFAYRALSGVPAKEHTGTVNLSSRGQTTLLTWRVDSTPKLPLPAGAWTALVKPVINQLMKGIVKESQRRTSAGV
jgi:uncharacterized protein YndB with AHSA1/START domain